MMKMLCISGDSGEIDKVSSSYIWPCWRTFIACANIIAFILVLAAGPVAAQGQGGEARWVTDSFEITMRSGKDNRQAIIRMLKTGTKIELLKTDDEAGYSLVKTSDGAEGWVLNRYLLSKPPSQIVMPEIEARLQTSESTRKELQAKLRTVERERDQSKRQLNKSQTSGQGLEKELDDLRRLSASAIKLDNQNKSLRQSLAESQASVEKLQIENRRLGSRANREWFIIGAFVVLVGMLIGLILPRIRWRKKSSWGDL
jgi:SH3 domain protein